MALNLPEEEGEENLFQHSETYNQGIYAGNVRVAQATIVVALDGTGDFETIHEALTELPADGGVIFIKEGTYVIDCSDPIVIDKDNVTLQGTGRATILKCAVRSDVYAESQEIIDISNQDYITLENLRFNMNHAAQDDDEDRVLTGIRLTTVTESTIRNCWFDGCDITASNFAYIRIATATTSSGLIITNNFLSEPGDDTILDDGTLNTSIISYNTINLSSGTTSGISVTGRGNTITANTLTKVGITVRGSNNLISGNALDGHGIKVDNDDNDDNIIIGNTITGATTGIHLQDDVQGYVVSGNTIELCTTGIWIDDINGGYPTECIISNNSIRNCTTNLTDEGNKNTIWNNIGLSPADEKRYLRVLNGSGGTLVEGDVVVYKFSTIYDAYTVNTTTTLGWERVAGVVTETITNNSYGLIQTRGRISSVKVDGTLDINIGNPVGTFTTAGISCRATGGYHAYGFALEAYTTDDSNGVIDVLMIPMWQI